MKEKLHQPPFIEPFLNEGGCFMSEEKKFKDSYVLCIGGMNVDKKVQLLENLVLETSNPVVSSLSAGGVSRNIAENLGRLGVPVKML